MRIGILIPDFEITAGGGSTLSEHISESIIRMSRSFEGDLVLISKNHQKNLPANLTNVLIMRPFKAFFYRIYFLVKNFMVGKLRLMNFNLLIIKASPLNRIISKNKIDVVWCISPLDSPLDVPYFATIWDLYHLIHPEFLEVNSTNFEWYRREKTLSVVSRKASRLITGTSIGAKQLETSYGIPLNKILVAPFPVKLNDYVPVINRNRKQFFYPAQFWSHKNHVTLLHAFKIVISKLGPDLNLVLTGSDKGNLEHVKAVANQLGIEKNVMFAGFVSDEELRNLMSHSGALVFPSLAGPDNLPPLEAMSYGCPALVADFPGSREQFEEHAFYFDAQSVDSIAEKMIEVHNLEAESLDLKTIHAHKYCLGKSVDGYVISVIDEINRLKTTLWNW